MNDVIGISPVAQYNGNIASQSWGTSAAPNSKSFTYVYDKLNRLSSGSATDKNNESGITYDLGGNIGTLNRYHANVLTDKLAYTYTAGANHTNQLQTVANTGASNIDIGLGTTNYLYDGNGNMLSAVNTADNIHNKSFTYNLLNLPIVATVPNGTDTYTYDANGNKLRKVSVISGVTKTTDYISGIEYDNSTTAIGFIQTEEGKAVPNGTTAYDYTYYLSDNLGNTRITFDTKTGAAVTQQQDDYYPFGLEINRSVLSPKNEYLYNRKELQEELGEYDYGARFYDPVIARWTTIDPLIESNHQAWTPYAYVYNNPILLMDPDGRDSTQRAQAQAKAKEFVAKNDNGKGNSYQMGGKGNPGEPCDCSNLVSKSVEAGGEKDPNKGTSNGVTNIANTTTPVDPKDVVAGNIVILHGSTHTGIITLVQRDKDGNIVNEQMIDSGGQPSSGTSGPRVSNLITNGKEGYWGARVDGYRKWDTKPDAPSTPSSSKPQQQSPGLWNSIKTSVTNTVNYILTNM